MDGTTVVTLFVWLAGYSIGSIWWAATVTANLKHLREQADRKSATDDADKKILHERIDSLDERLREVEQTHGERLTRNPK